MKKFLAWTLISLTLCGVSTRTAVAMVSTQGEVLKVQVENLPPGTSIEIKLKSDRQIKGQLVARSEDGFDLAAPERVAVRYADLKSVRIDPDAQTSPGATQNAPRHTGHFVRNAVIGFAVGAVFLIVLAANAKK